MRNQPPCVKWADKLGLNLEDLSQADSAALNTHLKTCSACRTALTDYHFLTNSITALPPPAVKPLPRLSLLSLKEGKNQYEDEEHSFRKRGEIDPREEKKSNTTARILSGILLIASILIVSLLIFHPISKNSKTGSAIGRTMMVYSGHSSWVHALSWSPNGSKIASVGDDHALKIWNPETGKTLITNNTISSSALAWSPDGNVIAFVDANRANIILIENILTRKILFTYRDRGEAILALAWSPNGNAIVSGDNDGTVQLWEVGKKNTRFTSSYNSISAVAWSPNGSYIALASFQDTVEVLDAHSGKVVANYTDHIGSVSAIAWSPDGSRIASASYDNTVRVWDARNGKTLFIYKGHNGSVSAVAWSPDGNRIASSSENIIRIWRAS